MRDGGTVAARSTQCHLMLLWLLNVIILQWLCGLHGDVRMPSTPTSTTAATVAHTGRDVAVGRIYDVEKTARALSY